MSEMRQALTDAATRLFASAVDNEVMAQAEQGMLSPVLWARLQESGLATAMVSEARGGGNADLGDALAIVREAGGQCVPAPLAEAMLAEMALAAAGLPPFDGTVTVGPSLVEPGLELHRSGGQWLATGTIGRVPWGRHAQALVAIAHTAEGFRTVLMRQPAAATLGRNVAHEPRDTFRLDAQAVPDDHVGEAGQGLTPCDLRFHGALFRIAAMAGAMESAFDITRRYAMDRVQFGRPIAAFQAVQHHLATMASQVGAANAAFGAATVAVSAANDPGGKARANFAVAAAKVRVGEAAQHVAQVAHQVHGAIGFTLEYPLHRRTRRLWSWRDEFGSDAEWAAWCGEAVAKLGGSGLWPMLVDHP